MAAASRDLPFPVYHGEVLYLLGQDHDEKYIYGRAGPYPVVIRHSDRAAIGYRINLSNTDYTWGFFRKSSSGHLTVIKRLVDHGAVTHFEIYKLINPDELFAREGGVKSDLRYPHVTARVFPAELWTKFSINFLTKEKASYDCMWLRPSSGELLIIGNPPYVATVRWPFKFEDRHVGGNPEIYVEYIKEYFWLSANHSSRGSVALCSPYEVIIWDAESNGATRLVFNTNTFQGAIAFTNEDVLFCIYNLKSYIKSLNKSLGACRFIDKYSWFPALRAKLAQKPAWEIYCNGDFLLVVMGEEYSVFPLGSPLCFDDGSETADRTALD